MLSSSDKKALRDRPALRVYAARAWAFSAFQTLGVWPMVSPPVSMETPGLLERLSADFVYIRLHGLPDQPYLYGAPGWGTALSFDQVRAAAPALFADSQIFLEGCFGSRISGAFLEAGARYVVGCKITTWGRRFGLGPSAQIGREFYKHAIAGASPEAALDRALLAVPAFFRDGWTITKRSDK